MAKAMSRSCFSGMGSVDRLIDIISNKQLAALRSAESGINKQIEEVLPMNRKRIKLNKAQKTIIRAITELPKGSTWLRDRNSLCDALYRFLETEKGWNFGNFPPEYTRAIGQAADQLENLQKLKAVKAAASGRKQ